MKRRSKHACSPQFDEVDADLRLWPWRLNQRGYPRVTRAVNNKRRPVVAHRVVAQRMYGGAIPAGLEVDHINRQKLDCRRSNLRCCTPQENKQNLGTRALSHNKTSRFRGVSRYGSKWRAYANRLFLGHFDTEIEAARAAQETRRKLGFPSEPSVEATL